jgi:hypothetical protein
VHRNKSIAAVDERAFSTEWLRHSLSTLFQLPRSFALICIGAAIAVAALTTLLVNRGEAKTVDPLQFDIVAASGKVPIFAPIDFYNRSVDELVRLRSEIALRSGIASGNGELGRHLFASVDSSTRWFSHVGFYAIGGNPAALFGPTTKESTQFLNPAVLIYPELVGLSIWEENGLSWSISKAPLEGLKALPLYPRLSNLVFDSENKWGAVTLNVRAFMVQAEQYTARPLQREKIALLGSALNARDLGFKFGKLNISASERVTSKDPKVVEFHESYGTYQSCYGAGPCNFLPLDLLSFADLTIESIPARAQFDLWKEAPSSDTAEPDYSFVLHIE